MKNILIILLFFTVSTQAQPSLSGFTSTQQTQLKAYVAYINKLTADSVRREYAKAFKDSISKIRLEYNAADITSASPLIVRLNNQNNDRIALQKNFDTLNARVKAIEDSTRLIIVDSSIRYVQGNKFDSLKNVFNLLPMQKAIDELSYKTGQDIDILKQYMILQKKKYLELSQ